MASRAPNIKRCQTKMSGEHPNLSDGVVERVVCVKNELGRCHKELNFRVRNCGAYYVYNFPSTLEFHGFSYCFKKGIMARQGHNIFYLRLLNIFLIGI